MSLVFALLIVEATAVNACSYDQTKFVGMSFQEFDQNMTGGWRELELRGCQTAAADLIHVYRDDSHRLRSTERSVLSWHEGQLRAIAGDYRAAIPLLLGGVPERDPIDFTDYALGTVAFLQRDKQSLIAARARLALTPRPASFGGSAQSAKPGEVDQARVNWPINLNVLDGLIRCFDQPYKVAYNCKA